MKKTNNQLEQRVADRTYRLQVMTLLSRKLNEIRDLDHLLVTLVNELERSFDDYHALVYLIEKETGDLVLANPVTELDHRIKLSTEQSIAGRVARTNRYFLSNDVTGCDIFTPYPLLPRTQSELAVPLRMGNEVIGVLDIQSPYPDHFTGKDASMLQSIADGAAIAINNARLLAEREATIVKLQELDRAKSQFLGVVSHELRTPMNAIIGFSEMLLAGVYGELQSAVQRRVLGIHTRGQHLVALINNLLDVTQMEAGQFKVVLEAVDDIPDIVDEVIASLKTLVGNKSVDLIAKVPRTLPSIQADRRSLHQILLNLGGNAVKFTPEGTVTIEVSVNWQKPDRMLFSVIDTGVGLSSRQTTSDL